MKTSSADSPEILIVAAEASSSLYALRLLEHWQKTGKSVRAFGIGNRDMEKIGFECLGRSEELAVVGFSEVIKHWGDIRGAFDRLVEAAAARRPKVVLLLDYPDFNLRLAKKLKKLGLRVVYYISPQVWAWRQGRVKLIRKVVDRMMVVFPFEVDFYQEHDVPVDFVGHPLLDEIRPDLFDQKEQNILRQRYGIGESDLVLGLMPGSRNSELGHHLETQLKVAQKLIEQNSHVKAALLVAPNFSVDEIRAQLPQLKMPLTLVKDEPFRMISLVDVMLCASGTATLMVGLMGKPMVIMYKMSPMTAWIAKTFVRSTSHFGLINLVLGESVVPELFQGDASVERLSEELTLLLQNPTRRAQLHEKLMNSHARLGQKGATVRVAEILESML